MLSSSTLLAGLAVISLAYAHLELTYPGTRGNQLLDSHGNTTECVLGTIDDYSGGRGCFPYGMEWMYPCGGLPVTTNRTYWPTTGGAVAFQPGWFAGHSTAFIYINLGIGLTPDDPTPVNMSHPMTSVFQISGPTNEEYSGRNICIPQVGMPKSLSLPNGTLATIQVVEAAKHGAALYSCVDVILTDDMSQVQEVTPDNCFNDSSIDFNMIITTLSLTSAAKQAMQSPMGYSILGLVALVTTAMFAL